MIRTPAFILLISILFFALPACSGGGSPIAPPMPGTDVADSTGLRDASVSHPGRVLWGIYSITLDPVSETAEIVPLRTAQFGVNVTRFMQPPDAPTHMISLAFDSGASDFQNGLFVLDVTLEHPFPGLPSFRGFDVRGILFVNADSSLPGDPSLEIAGEGGTQLLNADGFTRWWNPTEFTKQSIFGFWPGGLAPDVYPTAILNPYKYFCDDLGAESALADVTLEDRGTFSVEDGVNTRRYEIQFEMDAGSPVVQYNYAIDASWVPLGPGAVSWDVDDFPLSANCNEAWWVEIDTSKSAMYYSPSISGGELVTDITVHDWQATAPGGSVVDEVSGINLHSTLLSADSIEMFLSGATLVSEEPGSATWVLTTTSTDLEITGLGDYDIWAEVFSADPDTYIPQTPGGDSFPVADGPLAAYAKGTATVSDLVPQNAPTVIEVIPNWGYLETTPEGVQVIGTNFITQGLIVDFETDTYMLPVSNVNLISDTEIQVDLDLHGAELGFYDVTVTVDNLAGPGTLEGTLEDGYRVGESWPQLGKNRLRNCLSNATGPQSDTDLIYSEPCETANAPETLVIGPDPDDPAERLVYFGYFSSSPQAFTVYRAIDGSAKWTVNAPAPYNYYRLMAVAPPGVPGPDDEIGTVYVWAYPPDHAAPEQVVALSAHDGSVLWTWTAPQNGSWLHLERFGLVLENGDFLLCHATYSPYYYYMTCLDRTDGTEKWQIETPGHQTPDPVLSPDGNTLYIDCSGATPGPRLRAYNLYSNSAVFKWDFFPGWFPEQQSGPIVTTDGTIICAAKVQATPGVITSRVFAITDNGTSASLKWETVDFSADHVPWSQLAEGPDGSIYAAIGYPTAAWGPNTLYRLDPDTGDILNQSDPMDGLECRSGLAIGHDGLIYAGVDGHIYCFNQDCSLNWSVNTGRCTDAALDVDGSLFVADVTNGLLYRFMTE